MPTIPLHRKLLDQLDDADHSFKCARLHRYLQDVSIEPFIPSDDDSNNSTSSISSISTVSSFDSDDKSFFLSAPSLSPSVIEKMYFVVTHAEIARLRREILATRVLHKNPAIMKMSQLPLLKQWRSGNLDQYRRRVRVDPDIFDSIANKIRDHRVFHNNSNTPQAPVEIQLAIFLFQAGYYGNAASPEAIGLWAGVSPGTVSNCTNRVMMALLSLHNEYVHLPTAEEKESAKAWVAEQVCPKWSDRCLMVDGTKFSLFQRPGLHGNIWFDKN